jgi:hypothetical protein
MKIHDSADEELRAAVAYYEACEKGLGDEFFAEVLRDSNGLVMTRKPGRLFTKITDDISFTVFRMRSFIVIRLMRHLFSP